MQENKQNLVKYAVHVCRMWCTENYGSMLHIDLG